jgi:hypothetical protein
MELHRPLSALFVSPSALHSIIDQFGKVESQAVTGILSFMMQNGKGTSAFPCLLCPFLH